MQKDFSIKFWNILGVKRRVHHVKDIFEKKDNSERKTKKRDKRADERQFNKFKNNDVSIGIEAFFINHHLDENNFYLLCGELFKEKDEKFYFYRTQLLNILHNYKFFTQLQFSVDYFINLFAFQIAFIMEYMTYYNLPTAHFNTALEEKNIWSFIQLLGDKTKDIIAKTTQNYNEMFNRIHYKIDEEYIKDTTLKKDFSNWKNGKSLPELVKIMALTITYKKELKIDSNKMAAYFFQFMIIRALLEFKNEHVSVEVSDIFVQRYQLFKEQLHSIFQLEDNPIDKIKELQVRYAMDLESFHTLKLNPFTDGFSHLATLLKLFIESNPDKENENRLEKLFTSLNIKQFVDFFDNEQYSDLLDNLQEYDGNNDILLFSPFISIIQVITAYKIGERRLILQYEKSFNKSCGGLFFFYKESHLNLKKDLMQQIQLQNTFSQCLDIFLMHFKNIQR